MENLPEKQTGKQILSCARDDVIMVSQELWLIRTENKQYRSIRMSHVFSQS